MAFCFCFSREMYSAPFRKDQPERREEDDGYLSRGKGMLVAGGVRCVCMVCANWSKESISPCAKSSKEHYKLTIQT